MLEKVAEMLMDKLSADIWTMIMIGVVALSFIVTLVIGLATGEFKQVKGVMKSAVSKPSAAIAAMKKLPPALKSQYKAARMGNIKPSSMVTKTACVDELYTHSVISKLWTVTFVATVICGALSYFVMPLASEGAEFGIMVAPVTVFIVGGLFTLIGGIIGRLSYGGAVNLYNKFMPVLDGDTRDTAGAPAYSEPQQTDAYAQQSAYEAQPEYEKPQEYGEPAYETQPAYEPQAAYAEPVQPVVNDSPQPESDADFRKRAREEALAQARAQQAQAQARAQQQAQPQPQAAAGGSSSADEVIARINQIERDGATRDAMREVATQLQKERAKPENKSPERVRQLNDALSRLLKAMSGAKK